MLRDFGGGHDVEAVGRRCVDGEPVETVGDANIAVIRQKRLMEGAGCRQVAAARKTGFPGMHGDKSGQLGGVGTVYHTRRTGQEYIRSSRGDKTTGRDHGGQAIAAYSAPDRKGGICIERARYVFQDHRGYAGISGKNTVEERR